MSTAVAMSMDDNSSPQEDVGIMGKYYASKIGELREVSCFLRREGFTSWLVFCCSTRSD